MTVGGTTVAVAGDVRIALTQMPALQLTGVRDLAGNAGMAGPGGLLLVEGTGFGVAPAPTSYPLPTQLAGFTRILTGIQPRLPRWDRRKSSCRCRGSCWGERTRRS